MIVFLGKENKIEVVGLIFSNFLTSFWLYFLYF